MVLVAILLSALVALGGCTRPVEQDRFDAGHHMELEQTDAAHGLEASILNSTEEDSEEFTHKCCCYFPMEGVYADNPIKGLSESHCPARGCDSATDYNGRRQSSVRQPCDAKKIHYRDIYCKVTERRGCGAKANIVDQIPSEWKDCYGYKADGTTMKDCMYELSGLRD
mmetsp:Transcript_54387/g.100469  ORF Transcript_54387/g.100469 Transcript_54387/m.100469 type:complete len:168 (-) Transcript_54387:48-551(-)